MDYREVSGCVGYRRDAPRKGAIYVDQGPQGLGGLSLASKAG